MTIEQAFKATGINLAVLAGFWALSFSLVQLGQLVLHHWSSSTVAIVAAACTGIVVTRRVDARLARVLLLSVVAWMVAEAGAHAAFGIASVQGRETHLTVLAAGIFGVLLGFYGATARGPRGEASGAVHAEPDSNAESLAA